MDQYGQQTPARESAWSAGVILGLVGGGLVAVAMLGVLLVVAVRPEGEPVGEKEVRLAAEDVSDALAAEDYERYCADLLSAEARDDFDDCAAEVDARILNPTAWYGIKVVTVDAGRTASVWFDDQLGFRYVGVFAWEAGRWRLDRVSSL